jgi:hypothetical protein
MLGSTFDSSGPPQIELRDASAYTRSTTDEAVNAVRGGLAHMANIEQRLAHYFTPAEPRHRAMTSVRGPWR